MEAAAEKPPKILIVDDDRITSSFLESALIKGGYEITAAPDGETALGLFTLGQRFDTVILDRMLPGIDGLQILQHMKRTPDLRNIPVVMATGMDTQKDIWEGVKNGAFYYLPKPLNLDLLLQVVAAAVQESTTKRKLWAEMDMIRSAFGLIDQGTFRYQTMHQCQELAGLLASSCPDPERTSVGLFELMLNALEHGNLGISYEEKTALIHSHGWEAEMARRQGLPENRRKCVTVRLSKTKGRISFIIQDQGKGFPWRTFLEMNPERIFDNHGRGILMAKWDSFDRVEYFGCGNRVRMEILL